MAAITEAPSERNGESSAAATRPGPPRWVAVVIVVLLVSSAALWWAKREPDPLRLGNRGTVSAVAQEDCQSLSINLGELNLGGRHPIPVAWRGQTIQGQLTLDERTGDHTVAGTFTGGDGRTVEVGGGLEGEVFFTLACRWWPEQQAGQ